VSANKAFFMLGTITSYSILYSDILGSPGSHECAPADGVAWRGTYPEEGGDALDAGEYGQDPEHDRAGAVDDVGPALVVLEGRHPHRQVPTLQLHNTKHNQRQGKSQPGIQE
jgi:hypothetical protein